MLLDSQQAVRARPGLSVDQNPERHTVLWAAEVGPMGHGDTHREGEDLGDPGQRPDLPGAAPRGHWFWEKEEPLVRALPSTRFRELL